jgi:hypothetical protein
MNYIFDELFEKDRKIYDDEFLKSYNSADTYLEIFNNALNNGENWKDVVLEVIKIWGIPEEKKGNHKLIYLISGEAFNWVRLAIRIINSSNIEVPEDEIREFLFSGFLPNALSEDEFKSKIGESKFKGWQNYYYGIIVEQGVIELTKINIMKEIFSIGIDISDEKLDIVFDEIYGNSFEVLWKNFNLNTNGVNRKYYLSKTTGQSESEEFIYWLFKKRLSKSTPEVFASRVNEALKYLDNVKMNNSIRISNNND